MASKTKEEKPKVPKRSEDVQPTEQGPVVHPPAADPVLTPTLADPTLSADNQHSTYQPSSEEFPPDQGPQMEEVPGKP